MNVKKIWLTVLVLSGILMLLLTLNPGKVYAGGINTDGVYGDLLTKKTKKPTYSARTATQTQTLTPTITTTPTLANTSTATLIPNTPTKTKIPVSVDNAEAFVAPPSVGYPAVDQVCGCSSPAAMVIGFAGIIWMRSRKRNGVI